jgi:penicillin amidase
MTRRLLFAALTLLTMLGGPAAARQAATTSLQGTGLAQRVEIVRDRWGVNHIYAQNEPDLFFAQGYAAARDRLFQFELWRRQATGTVAEILGPREASRDIGARLLMFRGDLEAELNHYHPHGKAIVEAFVAGVNAYIAETERTPSLLPIEFTMLGIKPGPWTPAVVISRHQALASNLTDEVRFLRAMKEASPATVRELVYFQGGEPTFTPDAALDLKSFPDNVLNLYNAYRTSVQFARGDVLPEYRSEAPAVAAAHQPYGEPTDPRDIGSNNWVIAGSRTQSTFPILANDPHRVIGAPSLRYWVHLVAPGWDVIGGGEPVIPGVSIGHNTQGAWGLTIFGNDSEDLYVYETNPENANEYRYQDRWEPMRVVSDTIAVKGEQPRAVELKFTRHGPVLYEDPANHRAYAIRAAWLDVGGAPYLASLRMDQATTWEQFREACRFSHMPAENMIWADRKGVIGWQAAGIQPLRRNWSGLLPVPGDGRYEWNGYLPIGSLPSETDPARGFIATANNFLFPNASANQEAMHYDWADPYRASRITELLGSGRLFSVAEVARVQNDDLSIPARSLVPLLRDLSLPSGAAAKARELLQSWDFVLDKNSVAAGIYEMWQRRLFANTRMRLTPPALRDIGGTFLTTKRLVDLLTAPDGRFGEQPTQARDALAALSLDEAVAELTKRLGPDPARWQYGQDKFHYVLIEHPLSAVVNSATRAKLTAGPLPRGGDGATITATGNADNQNSGGSFKMIVDTENWDNSIGINTPGQAGNPDDRHYRDLFELWARGRYFTLAYSKKAVESVKESVTLLDPQGATTQQRQ